MKANKPLVGHVFFGRSSKPNAAPSTIRSLTFPGIPREMEHEEVYYNPSLHEIPGIHIYAKLGQAGV